MLDKELLFAENLFNFFRQGLESLKIDFGNVVSDFLKHCFVIHNQSLEKVDELRINHLGTGQLW